MRVKAIVHVLGKYTNSWKDKETNAERVSHIANIMQENGTIIDTLRLNVDQYNVVEAGKIYTISADYAKGQNGAYLNIIDITEGNR